MGIPIYCRPADIHPDTPRRDGFELFLFTGKRITFDLLFRYLQHIGYKVRYVRNITDVGHLEHDAESPYTVGPQTYIPTRPGVMGLNSSFLRESVL